MAKTNQTFYHRLRIGEEILAAGMVTRRGEDMREAIKEWLAEAGWKAQDKPNVNSRILGRRIPEILVELNSQKMTFGIQIQIIPLVDAKIQCDSCGYPHDEPNVYCDGKCKEWLEAEKEYRFDVSGLLGAFDADSD